MDDFLPLHCMRLFTLFLTQEPVSSGPSDAENDLEDQLDALASHSNGQPSMSFIAKPTGHGTARAPQWVPTILGAGPSASTSTSAVNVNGSSSAPHSAQKGGPWLQQKSAPTGQSKFRLWTAGRRSGVVPASQPIVRIFLSETFLLAPVLHLWPVPPCLSLSSKRQAIES